MRLTVRHDGYEATYDDPAATVLDLPRVVEELRRAVARPGDDVHVDVTGQVQLADDVEAPGTSPRLPLGFRTASVVVRR